MRLFLALASCAALYAGDPVNLGQLDETNRMFELRAELERRGDTPGEALLYRAIVLSRFGSEHEAVGRLRQFLAAKPAPDLERKARYELSWALTRLGEYGAAADSAALALRLSGESESNHADHENMHRFLEALHGVPVQTAEFGPPTSVQAKRNAVGLWEVPVEVNSQRGEWIFDSGANYSTVSESEARRLGLEIHGDSGYTRDLAGSAHPTRLAVAQELRFGSARLHNVVFLVLADQSLIFSSLNPIHGILGLPVMRALECVQVSAEGVVTFGNAAPASPGPANLFLDGLDPVVQVGHLGHNLQMMLDTGDVKTILYPSILDAFAQWEHDQFRGSNGGESSKREADLVPFIQLEPPGRTVYINRLALLRKLPPGIRGRDGILGIDALKDGFRIDFRAMRVTLN